MCLCSPLARKIIFVAHDFSAKLSLFYEVRGNKAEYPCTVKLTQVVIKLAGEWVLFMGIVVYISLNKAFRLTQPSVGK